MTELRPAGGTSPAAGSNHPAGDAAAEAFLHAAAAARASRVRVREIGTGRELDMVHDLFNLIWQPDPTRPLMTGELLRALGKSGNYIGGAFDGDELVGACVGFFGAPADEAMHSHIAGVSNAARGRSVGFALKLHQRAWSLRRGVSAVSWTYDPLVRRNAHFNLAKLAARPEEYLTNFYGDVHDDINAGDDTDRLLVRWQLDSEPVRAACSGEPGPADGDAGACRAAGAAVALAGSADAVPVPGTLDADTLLVAVPPDIERLRLTAPGRAKDWRSALREVLGTLMAEGARVTGFDRTGWYILRRAEPRAEPGAEASATPALPMPDKEQR
ncbi:GNAT family N-acetyltransferase [Streptomyces anthocyanicus]|uniref:GNAT family N-acetyltransferase n=1 Tax=Streptomyces anthocyanicus TaxID=68174 RepID=UPI003816B5F4